MRKSILLIVMVMLCMITRAQYYYVPNIGAGQNPGALNTDPEFPVGNGLPASWTVILGPGQASPAWAPLQTLPFPFVFNGDTVNTFRVSSSGVLTFASSIGAAPAHANVALPNTTIPDSSVCIWGMNGAGTNDNIVVKTFGNAPNRQHWVFFNSYTGENTSSYQYWSIVMEETSNKIYVVDQRFGGSASTLSVGIQINSTTAISVLGSPNLGCNAGTSETPNDNSYYEFIPGVQPQTDVWCQKLNLYPIQLLSAAPFTLAGKLLNLGSQAITSMSLNYSVNGGAANTIALSALNIIPYASYNYSHTVTWTPVALGNYTLKVWASAINGNTDQNPVNDTLTMLVTIVNVSVQRLPLHEGFTSSTCGPCVQGNITLGNVFNANPNKWSCVKYQMNWPGTGDPYYNTDGATRRTYYGVSSVPELHVDGGAGINTSNYSSALLNTAYAKLAFVNMTSTFTVTNKTVDIHLTINPVADINNENLKLFAAIVEKKTIQNTGINGETEFHFVEKKMVPNGQGSPLGALTAGSNTVKDLSYTFNGNYRLPNDATDFINDAIEHSVEEFSDLAVVLWIQDFKTREVFQSCWSTFVVGTEEMTHNSGIISLFPNPATSQVNLRYFVKDNVQPELRIFNMLGQMVFTSTDCPGSPGVNTMTVSTDNLPEGIYTVLLNVNGNVHTVKMNVTH